MYTKSFKAFTIVELMVVVVIVGILSVIGLVSYNNYTLGARDTNRIGQMTKTVEAFQNYATRKKLPEPNNSINLVASGVSYAKQGKLGSTVIETMELDTSLLDPKDKLPYTYLLANNRKHFQFLALMEQAQNQNVFFMSKSFAGYEKRYPRPFGSELGILTQKDTNIPLENLTITGSTLDITQVGGLQLTSYLSTDEYVQGTATDFDELPALIEGRGKGWRVESNRFVCVDTNNDGRCGSATGGASEYTLPSNLADVFLASQPFDDYWSSNTCSSTGITVVDIPPGIDTIPATLNNYTVYKFSNGNYILNRNSVSSLSGKTCLGFIGNGNTNIYTTLGSGTWFYRLGGGNNIFYGINFFGDKDGNGGTHATSTLFGSNPMSNFSYVNINVSGFSGYGIVANGNNQFLKNIKSFNNVGGGISMGGSSGASHLENILSYNNGGQGINTIYNNPTTLHNIISYNNTSNGLWLGANSTVNNSVSFNNGGNGYTHYSSVNTASLLNNVVAFNNSWGYRLNGGKLNNTRSYNNGWAYTIDIAAATYYGIMEGFLGSTIISYAPGSFASGIDGYLGFQNGVQTLTGSFDSTRVLIPSVPSWNYNTTLKQTGLTFDGNETYTYGALIPNQSRPLRYNTTTSQLEYYGVDGVDYDSTKKIGQW